MPTAPRSDDREREGRGLATVAALARASVRGLRRTDAAPVVDVVSGPHAPGQRRPDEPGHQPAQP